MEESYILVKNEGTTGVQDEEMIWVIDDDCIIIPADSTEVASTCEKIVVQENHDHEIEENNEKTQPLGRITYVTEDNMVVMQQPTEIPLEADQFVKMRTEEAVIEPCSENYLGSKENVEAHPADDVKIPLPIDKDTYAAEKPYPCDFCSRSFEKIDHLMKHMVVHQTDRTFSCSLCGMRYKRQYDLKNHLRIHDDVPDTDGIDDDTQIMDDLDAEKLYKRSSKSFMEKRSLSYSYVDKTMKNNGSSSDYANYPGLTEPKSLKSDSRKYFVYQHANVHGGDIQYKCQACKEVFWDIRLMCDHMRLKHGGMDQDFDLDNKDYSDNNTKSGHFICPTCGIYFDRQDNMKQHEQIHICASPPESHSLLAHAAAYGQAKHRKNLPSKKKSFGCSKCAKIFHNNIELKKHMLSHERKVVVSCEECGADFPDRRLLSNHRRIHRKTLGSRASREIHTRLHMKVKSYHCKFCYKDLADVGTLGKHERIHTEEKPYTCVVCLHNYSQRVVLKDHIRRFHAGTNPSFIYSRTPYACQICFNLFATAPDLIAHLIHHCDVKRAMKCQLQIISRPYKLRPHELKMMTTRNDDDDNNHLASKSNSKQKYKGRITKKPRKTLLKANIEDSITEKCNSFPSAIETVNSIVNLKLNKTKKKIKTDLQTIPISQNNDLNNDHSEIQSNGITDLPRDIASEQTMESNTPTPTNIIKVIMTSMKDFKKGTYNLEPSLVKGKGIVSKCKKTKDESDAKLEPENIMPDIIPHTSNEEIVTHPIEEDTTLMHLLADTLIKQVENMIKCEMCGKVFFNHCQLVKHVSVHI